MLDADETAAFDAAMRQDPGLKNAYREMESLTAAIAAATTPPVAPRAGQLESLQLRLGIGATRRTNWLGISGWAAAVVLCGVLILHDRPNGESHVAHNAVSNPVPAVAQPSLEVRPPADDLIAKSSENVGLIANEVSEATGLPTAASIEHPLPIVRVETKRLIQEIEVLRDQVENLQERDRERLEVVPDMVWPIVIRMTPPRRGMALVKETEAPPLTAMLGDALAAASNLDSSSDGVSAGSTQSLASMTTEPSAIPIYDAAIGDGTLYVRDLPPTTDEKPYILWFKPDPGEQPILVGRLPKSNNRRSEAFDFSLGAPGTIPAEFILTRDLSGQTSPPSTANTILQGPSLK
ncbi:hypothetical protein GCM10023212_07970 [Luteolibacter yonseiensis]